MSRPKPDPARYKRLMERARRVNAERDAVERASGFATPDQGPLSLRARTAMSAVECGIVTRDWNAVAEGQAMLEKLAAALLALERQN